MSNSITPRNLSARHAPNAAAHARIPRPARRGTRRQISRRAVRDSINANR